jgi:polysaccharide biosynthesis/export protein
MNAISTFSMLVVAVAITMPAYANPATEAAQTPARAPRAALTRIPYAIQPGDVLAISVWKEEDLQSDLLVRPDGGISFPLAGELEASGRTIAELRSELTTRLERFIPKPVVTVAVKAIGGNRIYVLGNVNRPGEFPFSKPLDVMQALSLAGGTNSFAALNDIVILHREDERLRAIPFRYSEVARGRDLAQNIVLQSGDTVVVP